MKTETVQLITVLILFALLLGAFGVIYYQGQEMNTLLNCLNQKD